MATSNIPNYLKVRRKTTSSVGTNASGFVDARAMLNTQTQVPLQAYVYSADYPYGLVGTLLCTGSGQNRNYWIKVTDSGDGIAIKNTLVEVTIFYNEI